MTIYLTYLSGFITEKKKWSALFYFFQQEANNKYSQTIRSKDNSISLLEKSDKDQKDVIADLEEQVKELSSKTDELKEELEKVIYLHNFVLN